MKKISTLHKAENLLQEMVYNKEKHTWEKRLWESLLALSKGIN